MACCPETPPRIPPKAQSSKKGSSLTQTKITFRLMLQLLLSMGNSHACSRPTVLTTTIRPEAV
ncbi:hypothetical protein GQ44DRAFT_706937 [Phaeosphaeriaceae sp. PMI808]|nr:hypothetical protein GQ44DRAFT_706937 [Phaeosphaeriaceae sp. PMI808]